MYGLPESYVRREPAPFDDWSDHGGVVWQPDVYADAARMAGTFGLSRIIDVGCGSGKKLVELAGDFDVIGVDCAETIERCRAEHRTGTWIAHDLDGDPSLPSLPPDALVVCSDVIEHLWHPERLMGALLAGGWPVVLSTPDRARTHGFGTFGPPPNPAHAQEWTRSEFRAWLAELGATVTWAGWTRSNDASDAHATSMFVFRGGAS
jgi:SAM-dependent methyltransferase